ncbi:MAG: gamma-glutamyl-gamma-aminobutyrate hydrolase family protein [Bryobacteraceae bacterium]
MPSSSKYIGCPRLFNEGLYWKPVILVLRHEEFEHLGYFESCLLESNNTFQYIDIGQTLPLDRAEALIVMGGPQSANDPDPGLISEMKTIETALHSQLPVLGICLGAQLMAKTLGARVYKNRVKEIGWAPVYFTDAAEGDALFGGLESPTTFCHWHGETFDMPPGAEWLAYSDNCRNQAFRYGKNAYGIQFHPEITPGMIVDWSAQPVNCGDVATLESAVDPDAFDTSALARRVLSGWLGTF